MTTEKPIPTIEQVVEKYIELRDTIKREDDAHKARWAPAKEQLEKIEAWILLQAEKQGVNSFATNAGTAYKSLQTRQSITSWDELLPFLIENDLTHLLTKNVSKAELLDYQKVNGVLPPGVTIEQFYTINVNRPRGKAK